MPVGYYRCEKSSVKGKPMRIHPIILAALCSGVVAVTTVRADERADKQAIYAEYQKSIKAFKAKNLNGTMEIAADDLTAKTPTGVIMNHQQMYDQMKLDLASMKSVKKYDIKIASMRIKKDTADVMVTQEVEIITSKNGADHLLGSYAQNRNLWVRTRKGWKLKSIEMLKTQATQDGRVIYTVSVPPSNPAYSAHVPTEQPFILMQPETKKPKKKTGK